jgi:hypothetical protein
MVSQKVEKIPLPRCPPATARHERAGERVGVRVAPSPSSPPAPGRADKGRGDWAFYDFIKIEFLYRSWNLKREINGRLVKRLKFASSIIPAEAGSGSGPARLGQRPGAGAGIQYFQ